MKKFVITDPQTGQILGRGMADEKSFAAWEGWAIGQSRRLFEVEEAIYHDMPEVNHKITMVDGLDNRRRPVVDRKIPKSEEKKP